MKKHIGELLLIIPLIVFGVLMLLFANPGHSGTWERADTYFIESIWSPSSGVTFITLGLVFSSATWVNRKKQAPKKPGSFSALFYSISFLILKITLLVYATLVVQYALGIYKFISMNYSYNDESMYTIHMVCIMFIVIFGIIALITGLISRKERKKVNA
jgi:hypothetical protein